MTQKPLIMGPPKTISSVWIK